MNKQLHERNQITTTKDQIVRGIGFFFHAYQNVSSNGARSSWVAWEGL